MDADWRTHAIDFDGFAERHLKQEWLLTNGAGAFAASTAPGCNTRRYHGLLIAAAHPPVGRVATLNQAWDQLVIHRTQNGAPVDQPIDLATLMFRTGRENETCFAPHGYRMLVAFERGASVRWTWRFGDIEIQRELLLHWKKQAITLIYRVRGLDRLKATASLRLSPMLTMRDFHALNSQHGGEPYQVDAQADVLRVKRGGLAITCRMPGSSFEPKPHWWSGTFYPVDHERGQGDQEDYFVPGAMVLPLPKSGEARFTCALGDEPARPALTTTTRTKRLGDIRATLMQNNPQLDPRLANILAIAGDDFVVDRTVGKQKLSTIIAGYPWFSDWGRDTFIALPGLLLCTGRLAEAKKVLRAFARCIRDGLVPNRFDDYNAQAAAAHYNTVDASLWFIHAAFEYLEKSGDEASWNSFLRKAIVGIVDAYAAGIQLDGDARIGADDDGLIAAGKPHTQLTWMDAAADGHVFTPRFGKPVEINALWYSALMRLAEKLPDGKRYQQLAQRVRENFEPAFWNKQAGGLYDRVYVDQAGGVQKDAAIRPNQVFAVSLPHSPLSREKQAAVVDLVRDRLLVPMGLRTLSPDDPHYHPRYTGDQYQRDKAYHQGTVWPWLIGPYAEAVLRVNGSSADARRRAARAIAPLLDQIAAQDLRPLAFGQLCEVYEAEPVDSARPVGCFAQAWSVAEVLRLVQLIGSQATAAAPA